MKRHALFVGVDRYEDGTIADLNHAVDDSEELAAVFKRLLDFERVEKLRNPAGKKDILRKVRELTADMGRGDLFFFYFAGHGFRVKENHVLACAEDRYGDLLDEYDGLPLGQLKKEARGPWNRMLVIDACQNDIRSNRGDGGGISARDLALILEDGEGVGSGGGGEEGVQVVVTSCAEGQRALEVEELGHGLFTSALLETVTEHALSRTRLDMAGFREEMTARMGKLAKKYRLGGEQHPQFSDPGQCGIALVEGEVREQVSGVREQGQGGRGNSEVEALRREMARLRAEMARMEAEKEKGRAEAPVPPVRVSVNRKEAEGGQRAGEKTKTIQLPGGATMEMVWCPKGFFTMGSTNGSDDEKPPHKVILKKGFWMAKTQVTQGQWMSVMGSNPAYFKKGDNYPVESVSWEDVQEFCRKARNGLSLPTEAEWEYACRAGTTGDYAGSLEQMAWYGEDLSTGSTHPVGQKRPNAWGLHDMHGNVREWCADWHDRWYYRKSPGFNPRGPASGGERVFRGGCYWNDSQNCRSAIRDSYAPGISNRGLGFRPVVRQD